jgi:uncharacterized integral membrane protein
MFRLILAAPLLLVLVLFAISNTAPVDLRLWPFDFIWVAPLAGAVLGAALVAFLLGALLAWGTSLRHSSQARQARREVKRLEAELVALRAQQAKLVANTAPGTALATPPQA